MNHKPHTEETKQKISKSAKERQTWLGRKHLESSKKKMSLAKRGKKLSESHKQHMREASKRFWSDAINHKIHSERVKERYRKGIQVAYWKDKKRTDTSRENMSLQRCAEWAGLTVTQRKERVKNWVLGAVNYVSRINVLEKKVSRYLRELGEEYVQQVPFLTESVLCFVDFYLPKYNGVLEVDGQHHSNSKDKQRDKERDSRLKRAYGIKTIRLLSKDLNTNGILIVQAAIESFGHCSKKLGDPVKVLL